MDEISRYKWIRGTQVTVDLNSLPYDYDSCDITAALPVWADETKAYKKHLLQWTWKFNPPLFDYSKEKSAAATPETKSKICINTCPEKHSMFQWLAWLVMTTFSGGIPR